MIPVVGGPLDGNEYELVGEVGEFISLNTPAGVCDYEFKVSPEGQTFLVYLGPARPSPSER